MTELSGVSKGDIRSAPWESQGRGELNIQSYGPSFNSGPNIR